MKNFFGFGSSTPPPPPPPSKPPSPPVKPASVPTEKTAPAASGSRSTPSLVGRWREPESSDTTEFHADGTVTERTGAGETIRGRYSLRDQHLQLRLDGVAEDLSFPISIGTDMLEMADAEGKITYYERIS